jgi:hypothetical protein
MSDETKETRYGVYHVREYRVNRERRTEWTRVGVAFPHKKGRCFNIELSAIPLDGKLTIYEITEKKKADPAPAEVKSEPMPE